MEQQEINQAEWENPENWTKGSRWLIVYFSHKDSRVVVPKKNPGMGVTLNMAKPAGVGILVGSFLGIIAIMVTVMLVVLATTAR